MNSMILDPTHVERYPREKLRGICEGALRNPERIWDRLERQGIHVTPGVIYQAIRDLTRQHPCSHQDESQQVPPDRESGVSLKDVATLVLLAEKAGGVGPLIRLLHTVRRIPSRQSARASECHAP
ncbi:MAG TPA: hypothetical protein VKU02_04285 [Gemmataceae bacterium]|nr:hypothetical protein [Gemmataceae bacterium]